MPRRRGTRPPAALVALLVAAVLTGCGVVVLEGPGSSRPAPGQSPGGGSPVVGATAGEVDVLATDALADLEVFWAGELPRVFGVGLEPLRGGYFSVDPGDVDPRQYPEGVGCGTDPREAANNAFYCQAAQRPNSDSITYDRAFLAELADGYGRFLPALVMAHEFGHAVQGRVGAPAASIAIETQADCLAGAWTAWVAAGSAERSRLAEADLDDLLRGYFLLRDPVGTGTAEQAAHGSYFDRVSAFQEGFDDGTVACRDGFGPQRVFTQSQFTRDDDFRRQGNLSYDRLVTLVETALPAFWEQAFAEEFGGRFDAPPLAPFAGRAPGCAPADRDLVYCADGNVVAFDEGLTTEVYRLGDFAVATAISVPYALGAREQLGLDPADPDALRSAVCLTGWFSAEVNRGAVPGTEVSPGDIDESVLFLLSYGVEDQVLGAAQLSGFQLVDVFRGGFVEGAAACDVGV